MWYKYCNYRARDRKLLYNIYNVIRASVIDWGYG